MTLDKCGFAESVWELKFTLQKNKCESFFIYVVAYQSGFLARLISL